MLEKIMLIIQKVENALKRSPMEILLGCIFFVFWLIWYGPDNSGNTVLESVMRLFPVFFVFTFVCNHLFKGSLRFLYYVSGFLFVPFLCFDLGKFVFNSGHFYSWLIAGIAFISYGWSKDNVRFTWNAVKVVVDFCSAAFITGTLYLAVVAIYFSIAYIFNIMSMKSSDFYLNMFIFSCFVVLPVFFLAFNEYKIEVTEEEKGSPVFIIFINYVLSPAIIIYTCILYIYFAKIAILWELPKGNIAYMVFAFILSAVVGQACHQLLEKKQYNWFYNYFSWISFPPLIIFWIGVIYRIRQYGFTDDRVYLFVSGLLMTLCILLFLNKRTGKYAYVSVITIISLSLITFIPPISAGRLGLCSQQSRLDKYIKVLGIAGTDGKLVKVHADNDTIQKQAYKELYETYSYVSRKLDSKQMLAAYGYADAYELKEHIIPSVLSDYVMWGNDTSFSYSSFWIRLKQSGMQDVKGFTSAYPVANEYNREALEAFSYSYSYNSPVLEIKDKEDKAVICLNMNDYVKQLLGDELIKNKQSYDMYRDSLFYDADFGRIVFKEIALQVDTAYHVNEVELDYLLTK